MKALAEDHCGMDYPEMEKAIAKVIKNEEKMKMVSESSEKVKTEEKIEEIEVI